MNVSAFLRRYLLENPSKEAVVPDFGVFYRGKKDGKDCILFKEVVSADRSFVNSMAFDENLSDSQVRDEIEKWVGSVLVELKGNGKSRIEGVGTFLIDGRTVQFSPEYFEVEPEGVNFGLEPAMVGIKEGNPNRNMVNAERQDVGQERNRNRNTFKNTSNTRNQNVEGRSFQNVAQENTRGQEAHVPRSGQNRSNGSAYPSSGNGVKNDKRRVRDTEKNSATSDRRQNPFYASWWFITICVLVVLMLLALLITPVRISIFGSSQTKEIVMPSVSGSDTEALVEEGVDQMLADAQKDLESEENWSEDEKSIAEENAAVAAAVVAGQVDRAAAEAEAKAQVRQKTQTTGSSSGKTSARKVVKEESSSNVIKSPDAGGLKPQVPLVGKFYIIVGSFTSLDNARRMAEKMISKGYTPTVLYVKAKDMYYVSVRTCSSREQAVAQRTEVRERQKLDCWIFSN